MYLTPKQYIPGTIKALNPVKRKAGNPGGTQNRKLHYKDIIAAFDIETTRLSEIEQSIMYVWQLHLDGIGTIIGRTWNELLMLLKQFRDELQKETLCIFVHNLSYEFQFLQAIYNFQQDEVFAVDSRKVLKCTMWDGAIEFRCSYLHSNMSLAQYTKKMGVAHAKLSGDDFDYTIRRYPWTPLTDSEIAYCTHDVLGLVEAIKKEMAMDGDNLYTFPLTSTGYVRRDAKAAMRQSRNHGIKDILPDYELYKLLREAFRGGNTHANRYYADRVLHNVKSADRISSYPEVMCNHQYPVSQFHKSCDNTPERVMALITKQKKAVVCRVKLWAVRLIDELWGCPYLSFDKCRNVINGARDNGRILSADYLETSVTDVDLKIILGEYEFDNMEFTDVYYARYGNLPEPLIDVVQDYYRKKTELKNVPGQEVYYTKSKNKLNSCYGMMAQDPGKQSNIFKEGEWAVEEKEQSDILDDRNKHAFLAYQWGVWVTAWARYELEEGLKIAGHNFVYCDTDSVKHVGDCDFSVYNRAKEKRSKETGAYATDKHGETFYMGVYESDGTYADFATMGAKKYVYTETPGGETHCTIAGVNKKLGGKELDKHGGIAAFRRGFVFREAGGTESVYNDHPTNGVIEIDGHKLLITPNIVIRESEYTLGVSRDYASLLLEIGEETIDFFGNL